MKMFSIKDNNKGKKLLAMALGATLAIASFSGSALAAAKYTLKVAYENNPGEPFDLAIREWARLFNEKTNGQGS